MLPQVLKPGGVQSLTFKMGARKTEVPVRMKTMMPVTLCSLAEKSTFSGVTSETFSDHSQPPAPLWALKVMSKTMASKGFCISLRPS